MLWKIVGAQALWFITCNKDPGVCILIRIPCYSDVVGRLEHYLWKWNRISAGLVAYHAAIYKFVPECLWYKNSMLNECVT